MRRDPVAAFPLPVRRLQGSEVAAICPLPLLREARLVIVLVHAAPVTLEPYRHLSLGVLCSPRRVYGDEITRWVWAADNDAYSRWDEGRYRAMLDRIAGRRSCVFVTSPDVVGDWAATRELWEVWRDELADRRLPAGYVLQDDQPAGEVPWAQLAAVFVGGSDGWKMGRRNRRLVAEAHDRGKWVHMGRVNGHRRMRYAKAIGCDSIDGTSLSWFRDRWLREFVAHAAAEPQLLIEELA